MMSKIEITLYLPMISISLEATLYHLNIQKQNSESFQTL